MRGIFWVVIVVLVFALLGWITFGNNDSEATLNIEKEKIRQDVETIKESGEELGDKIKRQIDSADADQPPKEQP